MAGTTYLAVQRRGKAWVVGAVTDDLRFLTGEVDKEGISSISLQESVESAHTKNNMGITVSSVYFNKSLTGNVTLVYKPGKSPRAGDVVVYTDPDDGNKEKALQILNVGKERMPTMNANTMPVSLEWFEGWADDATVIAAASAPAQTTGTQPASA